MRTTALPNVPALGSDLVAWTEWVAFNALAGACDPERIEELVSGLVSGGSDRAGARAVVEGVLASPILAAAQRRIARGAALEQVARLRRAIDPEPLTDRPVVGDDAGLDEATLYRDHWTAHRPIVVRGAARAWPSARWTFADLRIRFGSAPLDVGERGPGWWHAPRKTRRMAFGALLDAAAGDGLYADGRCNVLDQAGLAGLRSELGLLPGLRGDGHPRAWVGPAGTLTPTHHDQSSAWQVVLLGRKRLFVASPLEPALASTLVGLYSTVDPRAPSTGELAAVRWHEVELGPGDALYMPVGWFHQVEALAPSFSVSFSGFAWPNAFPWFLPGLSGQVNERADYGQSSAPTLDGNSRSRSANAGSSTPRDTSTPAKNDTAT